MCAGSDNELAHSDQASANTDPCAALLCHSNVAHCTQPLGFKPKHLH